MINFGVSVEFENPYSASEHDWDFGLLFRHTGGNQQYRISVFLSGVFNLILSDDNSTDVYRDEYIEAVFYDANRQVNEIVLIVMGTQAYFFVNREYVANMDVSDKTNCGDICVATGLCYGIEVNGESTPYSNFTAWLLP